MKEIFVPINSSFMRPYLEHVIQANYPYLKKDNHHLERILRVAAMWMTGLEASLMKRDSEP